MQIQRSILLALLLTGCFSHAQESKQQAPNKHKAKPNFILVYTDDMGYSDAGPFGNPLIETPAIDRLASSGQTWTNFYAAAPVCTPSRGALLTGKLPVRTGLYGDNINVFFPGSKKGMPENETTLAEVFQDNQYATGMFGKWHLGDAKGFYPTRHGFNEWLGIPYSNDMDWEVEGITSSNIFFPAQDIMAKYGTVSPVLQRQIFQPEINDWQVPLIHSRKLADGRFVDHEIQRPADQTLITRRYTTESIRFMREAVTAQKPFFIYLAHSMPHVPLFRSAEFAGKSKAGIYGDVIEEIDWSLQKIIAATQALAIDDNTYIVFTSDNGPWLIYGTHAGTATPLRDGKGTTFDGGMRVMTVFSGPDIHQGIIDDLGSQTDLFATFTALAGFDSQTTAADSVDLSHTLRNGQPSPRTSIPFYSGSELRAFRYQDHKVHFVTQGAYGMKPAREVHQPAMLIDLKADVGEANNIAKNNPQRVLEVVQQAETFKQSITVAPSILDRQFVD
jgi:arylsulfatase A-like enzyme